MSKIFKIMTALILTTSLIPLFSNGEMNEETSKEPSKEEKTQVNLKEVSEAFGHLIGKNLDTLGFNIDIQAVVQGIMDSAAGKDAPMSENECVQAISEAQEKAFLQEADTNLKLADKFMHENEHEDQIVVLEKEKLHYRVIQEGKGAVVEEHFQPLIKYTGRFLDGSVFGSSKEEEMISLDETIPGFCRGIVGMKEGEKRTLFIHPELGYGTSGYLPPNSLLSFEIEVMKANGNEDDQESLTSNIHAQDQTDEEIALPERTPTDNVR
ncbi:MAG: FKBP-type peptidyl-prolyl cis-trans isomerase [Simkaniaceae bacterium]